MLIDTDAEPGRLHRVKYDVEATQAAIVAAACRSGWHGAPLSGDERRSAHDSPVGRTGTWAERPGDRLVERSGSGSRRDENRAAGTASGSGPVVLA